MTLAELDARMDAALDGALTATGLRVSPETALTSAVVYACVNVLAQTIASLPLIVYRRLPGGGKERADGHPLYDLLHDRPNGEMTSYDLRAALVGHVCLWGNAYAEIERSDRGINGLWPLRPDRMTPMRNTANELVYRYTLPQPDPMTGSPYKWFAFENIMHWRGLSSNGIIGYSPIGQAAEAIGVDMATRQYGARFFGNGSRPDGVLTSPKGLSEKAAQRLKDSWESLHQGLSNSQRVAVLEEGVSWTAIGIPPEHAQFLETRRYQRSEIAGLFRVPLHMINDLERATFSNIEHQSLEFVKYTLVPWLVQIEQAMRRDLFQITAPQRGYFAEHLVDGLLRGDIKSRYEAYAVGRNWGWLSADDIRELENQNPLPDRQGKMYLVPANMQPADQVRKQQVQPEPMVETPAVVSDAIQNQEKREGPLLHS